MNSFFNILTGVWFIVGTNFPMWLDGDKVDPSLTYTIAEKKDTTVLLDIVKYTEKGKSKSIVGYDYTDPEKEKAFIWKGKGALAFVKSKWEVKLMDDNGQWAVIWFSKTIFTPEGVDIISRKQTLDKGVLDDIKNRMLADSILKKHVGSLVELKKN
ncbi:MAG: hypothetical protein ACKOXB_02105 [Flavobacteriales bacterium]